MYAPHMQPQQLAYRPNQPNRLSFVPPQPSARFNIRVPWGTPVRFPQGPLPQFPIIPSSRHYQVPKEQYQGNRISYNVSAINLNNLNAEVKALYQQLVQALEQQAVQDSEIDKLKGLVQKQQGELDLMTQRPHQSKVELKTKQEQERHRRKVCEQKQQKEHKEWVERQQVWKEREQVLKDELAKKQSELENKAAYGDNMSDYTHYEVNQHQGRNDYFSNDRRTQYANNSQGNRRQRVPYNGEQSARQMGYPDHSQNNSREYSNPRGRQPYHQRN